jgi:aldehyde dehydrogenase (NAD+)
MTLDCTQFLINGEWVDPEGRRRLDVINPATEEAFAEISIATADDVDKAVHAARSAFPTWSQSSVAERIEILENILAGMNDRLMELADAISSEMGAPMSLASTAQVRSGMGHFRTILEILKNFEFEKVRGSTRIVREPIGVCGFITPWNWPLNQIGCKVAPAIAAGCTMVLKPSEEAPVCGYVISEIIADSGLPAGVFNMINGDGPGAGAALSAHPEVDMVSFTGSTRAGREVARSAADTIKRVTQELGGKSANIILEDVADFTSAVSGGVVRCFINSGQSCNAPTRMLVPRKRLSEAAEIARQAASAIKVGAPGDEETKMGPVVNKVQFDKIQDLIQSGIDEGAELVIGGTGRPDGLETGYYVKPTVFSNVSNEMTISREEIFGPVLCILPYDDDDDAVRIANDTEYGLSGYVSGEPAHAQSVARQLRTGMVHLNGAAGDFNAPFGGYKKSGNGREWGIEGFEEFLETKSIMGYDTA